jgi:phosphoesterase RecJ-like protein
MTDSAAELVAAARALTGAGSVVVCGHVHPDGDAVGSAVGLVLALRELDVMAVPTLADGTSPPATYSFLYGHDLYRVASSLEAPQVFVALDSPSIGRLGDAEDLARRAGTIVTLDHHPDNTGYGAVNVVDDGAAATGQIVWRLLSHLGVRPTRDIAFALYVALMTDTGRFSYGNTDEAVLRDAASMLDAGADPFAAYAHVYESRSPGYLRLLGLTLSRVTHANKGRVAYSWITDADISTSGALPEETEDLVDVVRTVSGVEAVILLKPNGETTRVSLRAKGTFDVGSAARALGGGGHHAASGATVAGTLEDALAAVLPLLPGGGLA